MTVVVVLHRILTVGDFVIDRTQTYQHQCHLQTFLSDWLIPRNSINFSQLLYTNRMPEQECARKWKVYSKQLNKSFLQIDWLYFFYYSIPSTEHGMKPEWDWKKSHNTPPLSSTWNDHSIEEKSTINVQCAHNISIEWLKYN